MPDDLSPDPLAALLAEIQLICPVCVDPIKAGTEHGYRCPPHREQYLAALDAARAPQDGEGHEPYSDAVTGSGSNSLVITVCKHHVDRRFTRCLLCDDEARPAPAAPALREALEAYRADPLDARDRHQSWRALSNLLDACDAALDAARASRDVLRHLEDETQPEPICAYCNKRWPCPDAGRDDSLRPAPAAPADPKETPVTDNSLPVRVVVDQNGNYWRDYGSHYSMCPVSEDNEPVTVTMAYIPDTALLAEQAQAALAAVPTLDRERLAKAVLEWSEADDDLSNAEDIEAEIAAENRINFAEIELHALAADHRVWLLAPLTASDIRKAPVKGDD